MNYYNEWDRHAAAWLRELIKDGLIPPGDVDERSIEDVHGSELSKYTQCHFFAGIGGWSEALRLAGWPDDRPVWTGSAPCQPYSNAGQRKGNADKRNLWPHFYRLIKEASPQIIFGEQVASSEIVGSELEAAFVVAVQGGEIARANKLAKRLAQSNSLHYWPRWVDGIHADLEAENYSFRFKVLGAHSAKSPQIRQRLYWMADAKHGRQAVEESRSESRSNCRRLADSAGARRVGAVGESEAEARNEARLLVPGENGGDGGLEHAAGDGRQQRRAEPIGRGIVGGRSTIRLGDSTRATRSRQRQHGIEVLPDQESDRLGASVAWADSSVVYCQDGKYRRIPTQPALFPLAHGLSGRVGLLRGAGNAIVPQVAAAFIQAYLEIGTSHA